jgi:hypothetical protein
VLDRVLRSLRGDCPNAIDELARARLHHFREPGPPSGATATCPSDNPALLPPGRSETIRFPQAERPGPCGFREAQVPKAPRGIDLQCHFQSRRRPPSRRTP